MLYGRPTNFRHSIYLLRKGLKCSLVRKTSVILIFILQLIYILTILSNKRSYSVIFFYLPLIFKLYTFYRFFFIVCPFYLKLCCSHHPPSLSCPFSRSPLNFLFKTLGGYRQADRQTDRQNDRPTDTQTHRQTDIQTERQTGCNTFLTISL